MVREAKLKDSQAIQNLICFYSEDGKVLFRTLEDIEQCIADFLVYEKNNEIIGICSLKFGWDRLVEIRSLGVDPRHHKQGIATQMILYSVERALLRDDCDTIFVLTYAVSLFNKLGFEIVDKMQLPQKVWKDCHACLHKEDCDETAMSLSLLSLNRLRQKKPSVRKQTLLKDTERTLFLRKIQGGWNHSGVKF
tara:strand:+ start:59 stop:637 length:579 start_codon:yes stop_codon:yes gene_type:complete